MNRRESIWLIEAIALIAGLYLFLLCAFALAAP
jgi:hypothetical protein